MTAAQTACMLVNLGYDDDNVTEALVLEYQAMTYDEARQLVAEAHMP